MLDVIQPINALETAVNLPRHKQETYLLAIHRIAEL